MLGAFVCSLPWHVLRLVVGGYFISSGGLGILQVNSDYYHPAEFNDSFAEALATFVWLQHLYPAAFFHGGDYRPVLQALQSMSDVPTSMVKCPWMGLGLRFHPVAPQGLTKAVCIYT